MYNFVNYGEIYDMIWYDLIWFDLLIIFGDNQLLW